MTYTARRAAQILGRSPTLIQWLCRRYAIGTLVTATRRELTEADLSELADRVAHPKSRERQRGAGGKIIRQPVPDLSVAIVSLREAARRYRDDKGTLAAALAIVRGEWT